MREKWSPASAWRFLRGKNTEFEARLPQLVLSEQARQELRDLLLMPNPHLGEKMYIGIGENNFVEKVYMKDGGYPESTGVRKVRKSLSRFVLRAVVDEYEFNDLLHQVDNEGRLGNMLFYGHTHPSPFGTIVVNGEKVVIRDGQSMLKPTSADIAGAQVFYDALKQYFPDRFPYDSIASNTKEGPAIRLYSMPEHARVRRFRTMRMVPQQTIYLGNPSK